MARVTASDKRRTRALRSRVFFGPAAQEALLPHAATKVLHFADARRVFRGFADERRRTQFEVRS